MNKLFLVLLLVATAISPAFANKAQTLILPQRVIIENGTRFANVMVKNSGDATGEFKIELVDMNMTEDGRITEVEAGTPPTEFSAIPLVRLSPRSVTLRPGEDQTVRILLRKPEGLAEGEYRSHVKVSIINDNVDGAGSDEPQPQLTAKARIILIIPLIIRHGTTSYTASLSEAKIIRGPEGKPMLDMYIGREGNRSSMGDIKVYRGGTEIYAHNGVPVYRPTARRHVSIPLPAGTSGPLTIKYVQQEADGGAVLAETKIP